MLKRRVHETVDASIFAEPKYVWSVSHTFKLPRNIVWAALKDADTWTKWLPLDKVIWTSSQPFSVGTTRIVEFAGQQAGEYFFGWEEGYSMAFRFTESKVPFDAFAESYSLRDVPGGCELTLKHAAKTNAFALLAIKPVARVALKQGMKKLEKYLLANRHQFEKIAVS
ncbi:MAG TPA: SRPBCC family protein [Dongiaceae bacterium]|nr:SRPBCC family protein [Dongiaceae bacterium]